MEANIERFVQLVGEIEDNSWCRQFLASDSKAKPEFSFSIQEAGLITITDVPSEPLESLLLKVRKLTMQNSPENLNLVYKKAKREAGHPNLVHLYEVWHYYWRLSFIKEPYLLTLDGKSEVMTFYKAYDIFINGRYFHSDPNYELLLYGATGPVKCSMIQEYLRNQFHWTVVNLCVAAAGLKLLITSSGGHIPISGQASIVSDFLWSRHEFDQMKEQFQIFSDWIHDNGGCEHGRWP